MKTMMTRTGLKPINPFVDWGFKYMFGREESKDLLLEFLNLLLKPDVPIREIVYLNPEVIPDKQSMKRCVFDVLCTDDNGDRYLIEMQKVSRGDMANRLVYYVCRLIDSMGRRSKKWDYSMIKRVYAICLMNYTYDSEPCLRNDIMLRNARDGRAYSDLLNIITLQIPYLRAESLAGCKESYEKLLYLLKSMSKKMKTTEELLAEIDALHNISEQTKDVFRRVVMTVEEDLTEEQWRDYEKDLDQYQDTMAEIETARKEGRDEGIKITAKAMKSNGVDIKIIAACTGLSESEITSL